MKNLSAPLNVYLSITNKCNLNCKHCLAVSGRGTRELTTDELLEIIRQIRKLQVFQVSIVGGEPLMRKDFFKILEALSKTKAILTLNTNATLITKDIASKLAGFPALTYYKVSLDNSSNIPESSLRGMGSLEKSIRGIRNLVGEKRNISVITTVTRLNYKDVENIVLLSKRLGAHSVKLNDVMYVGSAESHKMDLAMTIHERVELLRKIEVLKKRFGDFITGQLTQLPDVVKKARYNPQEIFPLRIGSCDAATRKCFIRPDGWVVPCEFLWDVKAGDLKKDTLYDIWNHSPVMKAFRGPIEVNECKESECVSCKYIRLCKGNRCQFYYFGLKTLPKKFYCWKQEF